MANWSLSKHRNHCLIFLLLTGIFGSAYGAAATEWKWRSTPSSVAWKEFQGLSPRMRSKLWQSDVRAKVPFEQMAWEWRLAWVQTCSSSVEAWCSDVFQKGLFDRALVVRAETAARFGERFAGTGHAPALRLLATAYAVRQNQKNQQPLYVQYRILHAIKQIGGKDAQELGARLSDRSTLTSRYWGLLENGRQAL